MFTDQRKDKKAVLYLRKKLAVLEWIKDNFQQRNEPIENYYKCNNDLIQLLEDGVILCKLINLYFPKRIDKIIYPKSMGSTKYFLRIENINSFIQECQRIGVPIIFQTLDLFECKNPVRVVNCIHSLIELIDPSNNLKDRVINKKSKKFSTEDIARASLELQIEKEASGKSISTILYDTINPSLDHSSILSTDDHGDTTTHIMQTPLHQQQQQQPKTPKTPNITPPTMGTVQYQMTNSNTYESNNLSVLNTSHLRTTIIKTPISRVTGTPYGGQSNTPQIHHTPGFPLSFYQGGQQYQEMATSSMMRAASISTVPVKTSPSPITISNMSNIYANNDNSRYITNSTYTNRYGINNTTTTNLNDTPDQNNNNNNNSRPTNSIYNNINFTPYKPSNTTLQNKFNNNLNFNTNDHLTVNDLNSTTSSTFNRLQNEQKIQQLQHQQKEQQEQARRATLLKQQEQQLRQQQEQQQQQAAAVAQQQRVISTSSESSISSICKDIFIFIILIISIIIWLHLHIGNKEKLGLQ